jgi:serine/threonine protein kinase
VQPATPPETAPSLERVRQALKRRYRVVRELGSGPTGVLCLAYETRRERPVAIGVLSPDRRLRTILRASRSISLTGGRVHTGEA